MFFLMNEFKKKVLGNGLQDEQSILAQHIFQPAFEKKNGEHFFSFLSFI